MIQTDIFSEAKILAQKTRKELGLGDAPIRDIFSLLESQQIFLVRMPLEMNGMAGAFYYDAEKRKAHMLINSQNTNGRQRFTAAHEYCHFLLDSAGGSVIIENGSDKKTPIEKRADCFAANFLMPEEGVKLHIKNILKIGGDKLANIDLVKIKNEYGVSWQALIYRLKDLGYAFKKNYREMIESEISALNSLALQMGMEAEMPEIADEISLPAEYSRLAFAAYFQGQISINKLAEFLRISYDETKDKIAKIELSQKDAPVKE